MDEEYPFDLVEDEYCFSMSRDITDQDTTKFHWWEPPLYLGLLVVMFWLEITFFNVRL